MSRTQSDERYGFADEMLLKCCFRLNLWYYFFKLFIQPLGIISVVIYLKFYGAAIKQLKINYFPRCNEPDGVCVLDFDE